MINLNPSGDPMIFENAAISLELCVSVLENEGQFEDAQQLFGLEVLNPNGAAVALDVLAHIQARSLEAKQARHFAMLALRAASKASYVDSYAA